MSKGSSSIPVGQDTDLPTPPTSAFKVVLVDSSGQVKDRIGYRFGAPGAQATANGWNKLSAEERRELTAEIQPFDSVVPGVDSEAVGFDSSQERDSAIDNDTEIDEGDVCYVVVLNESGTYYVVDTPMDSDRALNWVRTWHHDHAKAIIVDADDLGPLENYRLLSKASEQLAQADDTEASESDDSDTDGEPDELLGKLYSQYNNAVHALRSRKRDWIILVRPFGGPYRVAPGTFTKAESAEWIAGWDDTKTTVWRVRLREDKKLYNRQTARQFGGRS